MRFGKYFMLSMALGQSVAFSFGITKDKLIALPIFLLFALLNAIQEDYWRDREIERLSK